jgi:hypothetical protein
MSRYKRFQVGQLKDYSLKDRPSKVTASDFGTPLESDLVSQFLESLPNLLAAGELRKLIKNLLIARREKKPIIWGFGGHVVKVGLAPILIDLMDHGFVSALATNGSGVIHDFEIALCGKTSEDVEKELESGAFGMARETGTLLNKAIREGARRDKGLGESIGEFLADSDPEYGSYSLLLESYRRGIPLTAHIAIGTDIIHNHPEFCGASAGKTSHVDYQIFVQQVSKLNRGGVFLNAGSAVILPEVFLKAVTLVRNMGSELEGFTTANLDFIQHYRPLQNIVRRPVGDTGLGIAITGHHEILIPLLAALLKHETNSK